MPTNKSTGNAASKKSTPKTEVAQTEKPENEVIMEPAPAKKPPVQAKKKITPVDRNELVETRSCVYGELNYVSYSTGNRITWHTFGDTNWITVSDLMEIRNSQRAFFEKPWIVLVGDNARAVMEYLQIEKYYKTISAIESFDEIFTYSPDDIPGIVAKLSDSTKEAVARRAYALMKSGDLDSKKMITALEDSLGYDLTEPQ